MTTADEIREYLYLYKGDKQYADLVDYARRVHAHFKISRPFVNILQEVQEEVQA